MSLYARMESPHTPLANVQVNDPPLIGNWCEEERSGDVGATASEPR